MYIYIFVYTRDKIDTNISKANLNINLYVKLNRATLWFDEVCKDLLNIEHLSVLTLKMFLHKVFCCKIYSGKFLNT